MDANNATALILGKSKGSHSKWEVPPWAGSSYGKTTELRHQLAEGLSLSHVLLSCIITTCCLPFFSQEGVWLYSHKNVTFGTIVRPFCCAWTRRFWLVASHIVGHLSSCVCSQRILKYLVILDMTALRVIIAEPCLGGWLWESEPRKWEKSKIIIYGNGSSGILNLSCNPVHVHYNTYLYMHLRESSSIDSVRRILSLNFIFPTHPLGSWLVNAKGMRFNVERGRF